MSLQCALAGIPGAVTYKTDPLTYWLGRFIVKVEFIGIANLLLNRMMYPEYMQGAATADALAAELQRSLQDPKRVEAIEALTQELRHGLTAATDATPAEWVFAQLSS